MAYRYEVAKRNREKWIKILSIPKVLQLFKNEFIELCTMEGECIRLENVKVGAMAQFHYNAAHKISYRLFVGEIPPGMWVLHTCDNGWCVNPEHLYLGTSQDNVLDKVKRERTANLKLTRDDVRNIRDEYEASDKKYGIRSSLARKYGVAAGTITRILNKTARFHEELGDE